MTGAVTVPSLMMMTVTVSEESLAMGTQTHRHTHTRTLARTHAHTHTHTHRRGLIHVNCFKVCKTLKTKRNFPTFNATSANEFQSRLFTLKSIVSALKVMKLKYHRRFIRSMIFSSHSNNGPQSQTQPSLKELYIFNAIHSETFHFGRISVTYSTEFL